MTTLHKTHVWIGLLLIILSGCVPSAETAVPVEVAFTTPAHQLERGTQLDAHPDVWDGYGEAVDVDGELLVVGASEWNHGPDGLGRVYVYRGSNGALQETAQLTAGDRDNGQQGQMFGSSVAIDGTTIAVGAPGTDDIETQANIGAVYVFEVDGSAWVETAKLTPSHFDAETADPQILWSSDPKQRRWFGSLVALDGDLLAVAGAPDAITLFQRDDTGWHEQSSITIPTSPEKELFVTSLALKGDTVAVSTFETTLPTENYIPFLQGKATVYLFEQVRSSWRQSFHYIPEGNPDLLYFYDNIFGASVALSGASGRAERLAIGLPGFPDLSSVEGIPEMQQNPFTFPPTTHQTGMVTLFNRGEGNQWRQQAVLRPAGGETPPGPGFLVDNAAMFRETSYDETTGETYPVHTFPGHLYSENPEISFFGANVSLDQNRLAVTAGYANTAYVFEQQGTNWIYQFRLTPGPQDWEDYGQVIALNGDTLALGSPGEFGHAAYAFNLVDDEN